MKQIVLVSSVYLLVVDLVAGGRGKRIINGLPLPDHNLYNTQFVVALMDTHGCVSSQLDHKLLDCENEPSCGGSLITADFVVTACHCIVYEQWYADSVHLPPINRQGPDDFPGYLDVVGRVHNRKRKGNDPLMYRAHRVRHPLLNSMTIFAGHPEVTEKAPQRRHAASFFPHHLCAERHSRIFPDYWIGGDYDLDIGLVKSCLPFTVNSEVTLAPMPKYEDMDKTFRQLTHQSITCLILGWGTISKPRHLWSATDIVEGYAEMDPDILHHAFRFTDCVESCKGSKLVCTICTRHHGPYVNGLGNGDSGGPLICNGLIHAVNSQGNVYSERNHSYATHIALACIKDFITPKHLDFLSSKTDKVFHWIDGHPVTKGPGP